MIEYRLLNDRNLLQIKQEKLGELEVEHAKLSLNLKLAALSGIENDSVGQAQAQLAIVEAQHAAVSSWLGLDKEPTPENGQLSHDELEMVKEG